MPLALAEGEGLLVFALEGLRLALPASRVVEVLRAAALAPLPTAPAAVAGLLDLRGTPVPVLDLRGKLTLPPRALHPSEHFVLFHALGRLLGVRVDRALDFLSADAVHALEAQGPFAPDPLLSGVARGPEGLLLVHDPDRFLTSDEALRLDGAVRDLLADAAGAPETAEPGES